MKSRLRCWPLFTFLILASWGEACRADPPSIAWRQTATLAAPEAFQAAAADERHIYAIANTKIAQYDRATGKRLAESTGEARHLNSGFFWEGKLYTAHSNYPLTPEKSELMVLDPATMRLATVKDFGNFGGSLTWAVREQDHWWCNFARYGSANAETFLVKFDDDWREIARWTYPPEVIRELGRNSLSGGLWREGSLLVTGHDDPVLFELKLPQEGKVLRLVAKHRVPFTGQGIAADPATGGLVGIDRGKRLVVFAEPKSADQSPPLRLRVLTYNIHHGEGVDGKLDLARIAKLIAAAEPDLVAVQEVDQKMSRTGNVDQPAELARLTGMEVVFGPNLKILGGDYGNAVLVRKGKGAPTIKSHKNYPLSSLDSGEQRGVLAVEIALPGGGELLLMATHLDHRRDDAERLASAAAINKLVAQSPDRPALLAGDLNAVPESAVLKRLRESWTDTAAKPLPTIPVAQPERQIDFVLVRPAARWKVIETTVLDEQVASDHRPLLSVLELQPQPTAKE
jgi:endonuclease/exonuclease/phosphatase family metal-dependent hydrolase